MNETSATSASGDSLLPDGITTLTTIHFAIIAVLALFVIAGLLWGIKAKRSRKKASRDVIANACLLYTSDAADETVSVDLGGRRIIKKKKKKSK